MGAVTQVNLYVTTYEHLISVIKNISLYIVDASPKADSNQLVILPMHFLRCYSDNEK